MITPNGICECLSYLLDVEITHEIDVNFESLVWLFFPKNINDKKKHGLLLGVPNIEEENLTSVLDCAIWFEKYTAILELWKEGN